MNIRSCPLQSTTFSTTIACPWCHSSHFRGHGSYTRKGFHLRRNDIPIPIRIPRYRCLNPQCPHCTFSIPPSQIMRYCRFFWPCLLALRQELSWGKSLYHLGRYVWRVGWAVMKRAAAQLDRICAWVEALHQELTNGRAPRDLGLMVKISTAKIGAVALVQRWYRHRYPSRFSR